MTAQLVAFVVNLGVSFVLTPIIDGMLPNTIGFVNMANQFVQWAQIIVSALNTLASRYITIHLHKGEEQEANEYFSSVFYANMMMAAVFLIPALFVIVFVDRLFQVPAASLTDVQILFGFVFLIGIQRKYLQYQPFGINLHRNHYHRTGACGNPLCDLQIFHTVLVLCGNCIGNQYRHSGGRQCGIYQKAVAGH